MTKKERTIKACRELAAKYREPEGKRFFLDETCPLCAIHYTDLGYWATAACEGCPLADKKGKLGCFDFASSEKAKNLAIDSMDDEQNMVEGMDLIKILKSAFDARAAFFDKIIPILEKIPASRFTKEGWKYFDELDRGW